MKRFIEKHIDDVFFYSGCLLFISIVFIIRNISILFGVYIPFSGNIGLRFNEFEIWRIVLLVYMILHTIIIFSFGSKHNEFKSKKCTLQFLLGFIIMIGFELFFHFLGYKLGTTNIFF